MRPLRRHSVHKGRSARKFRRHVSRTHHANVANSYKRGGWRL